MTREGLKFSVFGRQRSIPHDVARIVHSMARPRHGVVPDRVEQHDKTPDDLFFFGRVELPVWRRAPQDFLSPLGACYFQGQGDLVSRLKTNLSPRAPSSEG